VVPASSIQTSGVSLSTFYVFDYLTLVTASVNYGDGLSSTCTVSAMTTVNSYRVTCPSPHTYTSSGTKTLEFMLEDSGLSSATFTATTYVLPVPGPVFLDNPTCLTPLNFGRAVPITTPFRVVSRYASLASLTVSFGDSTTYSCTWTGTGTIMYGSCLQSHVYASTGSYTVGFWATDSLGTTTPYPTQTVVVNPNTIAPASLPAVIPVFTVASTPASIQFTQVQLSASQLQAAAYYYKSDYTPYDPAYSCQVTSSGSTTSTVLCPPPTTPGNTTTYYFAKFVFSNTVSGAAEILSALFTFQ